MSAANLEMTATCSLDKLECYNESEENCAITRTLEDPDTRKLTPPSLLSALELSPCFANHLDDGSSSNRQDNNDDAVDDKLDFFFSIEDCNEVFCGFSDDDFPLSHEAQEEDKHPTVDYSVETNSYEPMNAVHMELQENAKLPTFNLSVDRSSSSSRVGSFWGNQHIGTQQKNYSRTTSLQEVLKLGENDSNLTELFLSSDYRSSAAAAYSSSRALSSSIETRIGEKMDGITTNKTALNKNFNAGDDGRHRTWNAPPLQGTSEKSQTEGLTTYHQDHVYIQEARTLVDTAKKSDSDTLFTIAATAQPTTHRNLCQNLYGRPVPLPISIRPPTINETSNSTTQAIPTSDGQPTMVQVEASLAEAIASAVAIACRQPLAAEAIVDPFESHDQEKNVIDLTMNSTSLQIDTKNTPQSTTFTPASKGPIIFSPPPPVVIGGLAHPQHNCHQMLHHSNGVNPCSYQHHSLPSGHAAAYGTTNASMLEATKQRSQFGFGGNHVVPSVPPPPRKKMPPATTTTTLTRNAPQTTFKAIARTSSTSTSQSLSPLLDQNDIGNGPAYERKKQRAKDARVKLNESIERLSVAIQVAGSQSKQRAVQLQGNRTMEEVAKAAESAKKWDRPSFVGTAAHIVQCLNTQCEILMREFMVQKRTHDDFVKRHNAATFCSTCKALGSSHHRKDNNDCNGSSTNRRHSVVVSSCGDDTDSTASSKMRARGIISELREDEYDCSLKRPKIAHGVDKGIAKISPLASKMEKCTTGGTTFKTAAKEVAAGGINDLSRSSHLPKLDITSITESAKVFRAVTSYLDPRSLLQSLCVSRQWKGHFFSNDTWFDQCVSRFGIANVRHWEEKLNDDMENEKYYEEMEEQRLRDDTAAAVSQKQKGNEMKTLYQSMSDSNVKPKWQCNNMSEGNVILGDGKIDNVVGAWISMVERSNGETFRSVKRKNGTYASLPVVELRFLVQNTGSADGLVVPEQILSVDASTRRRGEEMFEVSCDDRLCKKAIAKNGSLLHDHHHHHHNGQKTTAGLGDMFQLQLYESAMLVAHFHARGCSTTSKFHQRANFTKLLVRVNGTTLPVVITFSGKKSSSGANNAR